MPANLAAKNLAEGIWQGLSTRLQAAAVVTAGVTTAAVSHLLPSELRILLHDGSAAFLIVRA